MKNKIMRFGYIVFLIVALLAQYSLAGQSSDLSREKYAWGFNRGDDHAQPTLDSKPLAVLDELRWNCNGERR